MLTELQMIDESQVYLYHMMAGLVATQVLEQTGTQAHAQAHLNPPDLGQPQIAHLVKGPLKAQLLENIGEPLIPNNIYR